MTNPKDENWFRNVRENFLVLIRENERKFTFQEFYVKTEYGRIEAIFIAS